MEMKACSGSDCHACQGHRCCDCPHQHQPATAPGPVVTCGEGPEPPMVQPATLQKHHTSSTCIIVRLAATQRQMEGVAIFPGGQQQACIANMPLINRNARVW
jgi:hypothetical protein